mmetsp:Transcript_111135/g.321235  ORF Transcript_111135/g.321235 Transcript_111135/m.321235 type:complete len:442 (+) Transcript_111135:888-2213(+)
MLVQSVSERRLCQELPRRHGNELVVADVVGLRWHLRRVLHVRQHQGREHQPLLFRARDPSGCLILLEIDARSLDATRVRPARARGAADALTGRHSSHGTREVDSQQSAVGEVRPQSLLRLHPIRRFGPSASEGVPPDGIKRGGAVLGARARHRRQGHATILSGVGRVGSGRRPHAERGFETALLVLLDLRQLLALRLCEDRVEVPEQGHRQGVILAEQALRHLVAGLERAGGLVPLLKEFALDRHAMIRHREDGVVVFGRLPVHLHDPFAHQVQGRQAVLQRLVVFLQLGQDAANIEVRRRQGDLVRAQIHLHLEGPAQVTKRAMVLADLLEVAPQVVASHCQERLMVLLRLVCKQHGLGVLELLEGGLQLRIITGRFRPPQRLHAILVAREDQVLKVVEVFLLRHGGEVRSTVGAPGHGPQGRGRHDGADKCARSTRQRL